jgi:alanyl-tRNA synthetase
VKITRYRKVVNQKEGELYQLVFNLTPFYPEGGGQVGDQGYIESDNGEVIYVIDTKKENNVIVHFVKHLPTHLTGSFKAIVNETYRKNVASNHTATHLMHQALRSVLGTHVEQKGSLVSPKYLRFDFSHFTKVTDEELLAVEDFVNARISEALPLEERRNMVYDEAIKEGAIALFGEKYGDTVRAIRFGQSMELCGGIHAHSTSELWQFIITSESAVASGVRRIEAITKDAAKNWLLDRSKQLDEVKFALKSPQDIQKAISQLVDEHAQMKKQVEQLLKEKALQMATDLQSQFTSVNGVHLLAVQLEMDAASVKDIVFDLGNKNPNAFILVGSVYEDKPMLTCYIDKKLVQERGFNAGQVVKTLGQYIQGGGGGQPFFATAGGKKPEGISEALKAVHQFLG